MGIWCIITAALVFLSTGVVLYRQGKYREKELSDISAMLECILDDREFPGNLSYEDTLSSKIGHQLFRLQNMTKGYNTRLERDRDSIKNLITEIAHQMRTPLTNIETYLEFLRDQDLNRQEREAYLEAAAISEKKIHFLAESFIRMSRLEHRIIQIHLIDTDLLLTIEEAAGQVQRQAGERGIRIRTEFPAELVHAHDADWLGEAVFNLLENAVKYSLPYAFDSEQKEIIFGAERNEMFVRIWVRDFGTGIEEGEEAKVFQRFYRGKNAEKTEGFGLGLYLAREIVLLHHGFIKVKRQCPGTCVEIYLERNKDVR